MAQVATKFITVDVQRIINQSNTTLDKLSADTGIPKGKLTRLIDTPGRFSIDEFAALSKMLPLMTATQVI